MGQYYNILTSKNNEYTVYDRSIKETENSKPQYMLAKITEHSWIGNETMTSFSNLIYQNPTKVAWVGDYADESKEEDIKNPNLTLEKVLELHQKAWHTKEHTMLYKDFETEKMLLVNWDKKQYLDMKKYIERNTLEDWCVHPLSLLTAIGNGYGGGDYFGNNMILVGSWAFDTISFENKEKQKELEENSFMEVFYGFVEA